MERHKYYTVYVLAVSIIYMYYDINKLIAKCVCLDIINDDDDDDEDKNASLVY